ncbi:hypothetical protein DEO72_LG2g3355 [Vigna unguiculata]|uniref:Uncharacterized protein n=1 Tax=Vigna unguiculata TaxID=3917 RepID=A0A4D6L3D7_VIGUN|nr:hypothetical protein DEO72_LG2g3355 [Vigna unguiculata]
MHDVSGMRTSNSPSAPATIFSQVSSCSTLPPPKATTSAHALVRILSLQHNSRPATTTTAHYSSPRPLAPPPSRSRRQQQPRRRLHIKPPLLHQDSPRSTTPLGRGYNSSEFVSVISSVHPADTTMTCSRKSFTRPPPRLWNVNPTPFFCNNHGALSAFLPPPRQPP